MVCEEGRRCARCVVAFGVGDGASWGQEEGRGAEVVTGRDLGPGPDVVVCQQGRCAGCGFVTDIREGLTRSPVPGELCAARDIEGRIRRRQGQVRLCVH